MTIKITNLTSNLKLDDFIVQNGKAALDKVIGEAEDYGARLAVKIEVAKIRRMSANEMRGFEKSAMIAEVVIRDMKKKGRFLKTRREPYYYSSETGLVYPFEGDVRFRAYMNERYGINAVEHIWPYLIEQLKGETVERGTESETKKFSFYDRHSHRLYLSNFGGGIYRLDGRKVEMVPNGTDGVLFKDEDWWEVYSYLGQGSDGKLIDRLLINPVNFDPTGMGGLVVKDLRILWKVSIYSFFFKDLLPARPLTVFVGEKGSGKSTAIRNVLRFLFGPMARLHTISKKKEDAFLALVANEFVVGLDNVDDPVEWLNDHLAAIATGAGLSLRELYTTNKLATFVVDTFICLTSRTPRFNRDDVADRMLLFPVARIKNFIPDSDLDGRISAVRDQIWTEVINDLNAMVGRFRRDYRKSKSSARLADFAQLGGNIAAWMGRPKTFARIIGTLAMGQSLFVLQDDSLFLLLEEWLEKPENNGRRVQAVELHSELKSLSWKRKGVRLTYPTARSLAKRLNNIMPNLRQFFEVETDIKGGNKKYYAFRLKAPQS